MMNTIKLYLPLLLAAVAMSGSISPATAKKARASKSVAKSTKVANPLEFNPDNFTMEYLVMPAGDTVRYRAYKDIYYVSHIEDPTYQTLNIFVPDHQRNDAPMFLRTYVGGYMASKASDPRADDASGRALHEGFTLCIPGSRGNGAVVKNTFGHKTYTGIVPNGLLDLKAAVRYLRFNDSRIPGNAEKIITDGTSAGGAMSALLGSTGNAYAYEHLLKAMGAAEVRDDVYASICYCPITDLGHADMEYEWLYGCTNDGVRHLSPAQKKISDELSALCPEYIDSLKLRKPDGTRLTSANYKEYLKQFLIASAQKAKEAGCEIPDTIGISLYSSQPSSDYITGLDLDKYLSYVASQTPLKTPPAFDQWGVLIDTPSPENKVFGDSSGDPANFTQFSLRHHTKNQHATLSDHMKQRVYLMNPMDFIGSGESTVAKYWYIRHGAKDRDTSFLVPINLATMLENHGAEVDFFIPWNRGHSGDYNLDELFAWLKNL